ncbi:hypothetical protein L6164_035831 [Bauhinia variegata]|uniref:Uncharacterized protein n=1 Tax=Bauhinia variegata TaxID=167791 RepID=A0ACB9KFA9_BAUVA|nr:hypothetical protein L6164_035831 [Bauhinia variegata]
MLRYSNKPFFSSAEQGPAYNLFSTQLLADTMNTVVNEAANGGDGKKFATKESNFTSFQNLYVLAQCTPDLSVLDCNSCMKTASGKLHGSYNRKQGGRVLVPSCNIRHELYLFYRMAEPEPNLEQQRPKGKRVRLILASNMSCLKVLKPVDQNF